ncbi:TetR/AcrR family transcriptional regulator C-terminal domain-containing protein [Kitasatospora griseola]|uniref:TetR/AcrR family transcriptional regulator C-terminal domain-containing protein n=1 Tax=Kitasatospora griseola TaxID=2064 RepID=UPI00166FDE20|nr:TetR/AcrR family transcriptional regulator C-terminal domain-containing protein [Kitasatospora griseola]GGQ88950.1 transcriptional regulator [Kitasatospora griseola]
MPAQMPAIPWHKPRKADPRQPLSRSLIVDTAIRVLDAEGLAGVTMRRVAQELGTGPASLYAHVSNKEELFDLMLEQVTAEIRLPLRPEPERWKDQITEICFEAQRVLTAHRDVALVSLGSIPVGESQLRITEFLLDLLLQVGLPPQVAAWALDALGQIIDTDAYEAWVYNERLARGTDLGAYFDQLRGYLHDLPAERFPTLQRMADAMMEGDGDQRYAFKIEVFLRGLESFLPANAPTPTPPAAAPDRPGPASDDQAWHGPTGGAAGAAGAGG